MSGSPGKFARRARSAPVKRAGQVAVARPRPMAAAPAAPLQGFPPVLDRQVRVLILGSFPGAASLAAGQYYAHPRNQFWPIVGSIVGEPLAALPYRARLARLLAHRLGLWDVLGACERRGSLDTAIRNAQPNRFDQLRRRAPALRVVLFNGGTAGRFAPLFAQAGYRVAVLPSTSPAHAARTLAQKLALWQAALRAAEAGS